MTPTPQHQEQAEVMARIVIQLISPMNETACLQYLPKVLGALNLPQLLADQAERAIANKALEAACQCAEQFKKECNEADAVSQLKQRQIDQLRAERDELENRVDEQWLNYIASYWKHLMGKEWETRDGETREERVQANVAALFAEIELRRTREAALMAVARAAQYVVAVKNTPSRKGDFDLMKALTAAIQAGVKLEGV